MNRRGFLKTISAAFCGAMLSTFPDFAPATGQRIRFQPRPSYGGIHPDFAQEIERQYAGRDIAWSVADRMEDQKRLGELFSGNFNVPIPCATIRVKN